MIRVAELVLRPVLGACAGLGVYVVVHSLRVEPLAQRVDAWRARLQPGPGPQHRWGALTSWAEHPRARVLRADLEVMDRSPAAHALQRLVGAALGGAIVVLAAVVSSVVSDVPTPAVLVAAVAGSAALGFFVPDLRLRRAAVRRRTDVVSALSGFLDLVTVLLAGGAGMETALHAAARAGDGWTFEQLRRMLVAARSTRQSVWAVCGELGQRIAVPELVELGAALQLAGEEGARIAHTLSTRADVLRARVLAGVEAAAQSASERMGLPTVLMFVGFLVLLGYPAAQIILRSS